MFMKGRVKIAVWEHRRVHPRRLQPEVYLDAEYSKGDEGGTTSISSIKKATFQRAQLFRRVVCKKEPSYVRVNAYQLKNRFDVGLPCM